jgi:hypothetical protein
VCGAIVNSGAWYVFVLSRPIVPTSVPFVNATVDPVE